MTWGRVPKFQEQIEQLKLPDNVRTRILIGAKDAVVNASDPNWQRMTQNLGAEVSILPELDPNAIVKQAIGWGNRNP